MTSILIIVEMALALSFGLIGIMIVWGFWPLAWGPRSTQGVRSLSRAVLLISLSTMMRVVYYSGIFVSQETRQLIGKEIPNIISCAILIVGGYYMLRVLYFTIPEGERSSWNLLTAPFYPRRWSRMFSRKLEEFIENAKGDIKDD